MLLSGVSSGESFTISFLYLGQPAKGDPPRMPSPSSALAPGTFAASLTASQLTTGSLAEVYASGASPAEPDFLSILRVVGHRGGGLQLRYRTYQRSCAPPASR